MEPVLECVPNLSEGRDPAVLSRVQDVIRASGAEILDASSDPDHHRSVITFIGDPPSVEQAAVAAALEAARLIDLRHHSGVHPRVGALDVLPFIPFYGASMEHAVESARRVAAALADAGVPAYLYGAAAPVPRTLAGLRRGGFEALVEGFPEGRRPDYLPEPWPHPGAHPSAGVTCVGARKLLLAWNVYVEGVNRRDLEGIASQLRETGGGFKGLRALGLELPLQGKAQVSMNLEDLEKTSPFEVFAAIERLVGERGGRLTDTEVIGMIPDGLVLPAAADRLSLRDDDPDRLLSRRMAAWLATRPSGSR